jgi:hypothetical protein
MKKIIFIFGTISVLCLGIFVGIILENFRQSEQKIQNFSQIEISEKKTPVLRFSQIENGKIFGKIESGEVRIFVKNKESFILNNSEFSEFSMDIREILPMLKEIPHPKNTKFVASKRGKKFYPLDSPRAFLVTPKNRIFFVSKEEAEKKGFIKY